MSECFNWKKLVWCEKYTLEFYPLETLLFGFTTVARAMTCIPDQVEEKLITWLQLLQRLQIALFPKYRTQVCTSHFYSAILYVHGYSGAQMHSSQKKQFPWLAFAILVPNDTKTWLYLKLSSFVIVNHPDFHRNNYRFHTWPTKSAFDAFCRFFDTF